MFSLLSLVTVSILIAQPKIKSKTKVKNDNLIEQLMASQPSLFSHILKNKDSFNVQIIYTQINRDANNKPSFKEHKYNVNPANYFYPASTVKMPIAFLALEKLNELNIKGLDMHTTMITDSSSDWQTAVYTQPLAEDSRPTIANYIKQIFLVSDNDAFNRLYEFLGQEYILQKLTEKGYPDAIIRHRLQISLTPEQNRATNEVRFYDNNGKLLYRQPSQSNKKPIISLEAKLGKGYYKGGQLVSEPFDFTLKNRVPLQNLHDILQSVLFPKWVNPKKKFLLTEKDYKFVYRWLNSYPAESNFPPYDTALYWNAYCKFLYYGSQKGNTNPNIRIYNKVGDAYGFLLDVAYITDKQLGIEFMLSAVINCNTDGVYNDNKYAYDELGFPFMKNLGQLFYTYEKNRIKKHKPKFNDLE